MLKRFFSKPAVSRVEEKSFFFLVLYLKKSCQTSISKLFFFILGAILRTEDEKSEMNFEKSTNYFNL